MTSIPCSRTRWVAPFFFLLIAAIQFSLILYLNQGQFVYTRDDVYIHMTMARNLWEGIYGFNVGESASASSSILWPFLLAPFARLPGFLYAPLLLNITFSLLFIKMMQRTFRRIFETAYENYPGYFLLAECCFVIGFNLVGLSFMGMEHLLQMLLVLLITHGLIRMHMEDNAPPWYLWFAIAAAPLLRLECLSVSGLALLWLMYKGFWKPALVCGLTILLLLAGFAGFLTSLGLPPLPLSVLVQSKVLPNIYGIAIFNNLMMPEGLIMLGMVLALLMSGRWGNGQECYRFCLLGAGVLLTHLLFGRVGWIRYEAYTYAAAVPILLLAYREHILQFMQSARPWAAYGRIFLAICGIQGVYTESTYRIWSDAHDTYLMQFQMRRFAVDYYKGDVAANDIGLLKFDNLYYVLDFVGLANAHAQKMNFEAMKHPNRQWMQALMTEKHIKLVIIYEEWFRGHIPEEWVKLGELSVGESERHSMALGGVASSFFAVSQKEAEKIMPGLENFARSLPEGVFFNKVYAP